MTIPFPPSPRPLQSLVASATRLTSRTSSGVRARTSDWQRDAWEMYDLVGEQRFLATTLAGRMAQADFFVGRLPDDPTEEPEPVDGGGPDEILAALGAVDQLVNRIGVNLFVAGDCWLVGIPKWRLPEWAGPEPAARGSVQIKDLEWRVLSLDEFEGVPGSSDTVVVRFGPDRRKDVLELSMDEAWIMRIWRPHPRRRWEADSPTRSSLPVLRELVGLTMHISAQVDSRLAGAGLFIIPQSAQRALNIAAGLPADASEDLFTEALMEAMLVPIQDRASASALVPLCITVPDEAAGLFSHVTFAKPLDSEARSLRDEAIRRLALGQDAPPELLLGTGGMNHWGAWLVREDVVTTHIEPPLALICDALTTQLLQPVLVEQGMAEDEASRYVFWYDVSKMVMRPNRSADALELHSRGVLSAHALRDAAGFDESDGMFPDIDLDDPAAITLELVGRNPALLASPGISSIHRQIAQLLSGEPPPEPPPPPPVQPPPPQPVPPQAGGGAEGPPAGESQAPEEAVSGTQGPAAP